MAQYEPTPYADHHQHQHQHQPAVLSSVDSSPTLGYDDNSSLQLEEETIQSSLGSLFLESGFGSKSTIATSERPYSGGRGRTSDTSQQQQQQQQVPQQHQHQQDDLHDLKPDPTAKRSRGKPPYQWNSSWKRKLLRTRENYPNASVHQHIWPALRDAGGPGYQVTTDCIKGTAGEKPEHRRRHISGGPGQAIPALQKAIKAAKGPRLSKSFPSLSSAYRASAASNIDFRPDTARDPVPDLPTIKVDSTTPTFVQGDSPSTNIGSEAVDTPQALVDPNEPQRKRRRSIDHPGIARSGTADDSNSNPDKRVRSVLPRTDASQIDEDAFVKSFAKRTNADENEVAFVVKTWSLTSFRSSVRSSIASFVTLGSKSNRSSHWRTSVQSQQEGFSTSILERLSRPDAEFEPEEDVARDIQRFVDGMEVAEINATNAKGETALHLAVKVGNRPVCGILLWAGADHTIRANNMLTAGANAGSTLRAAKIARLPKYEGLHERIRSCRHHLSQLKYMRLPNHLPAEPAADYQARLKQAFENLLSVCDTLDRAEDRRKWRKQQQPHRVKFHRNSIAASLNLPAIAEAPSTAVPAVPSKFGDPDAPDYPIAQPSEVVMVDNDHEAAFQYGDPAVDSYDPALEQMEDHSEFARPGQQAQPPASETMDMLVDSLKASTAIPEASMTDAVVPMHLVPRGMPTPASDKLHGLAESLHESANFPVERVHWRPHNEEQQAFDARPATSTGVRLTKDLDAHMEANHYIAPRPFTGIPIPPIPADIPPVPPLPSRSLQSRKSYAHFGREPDSMFRSREYEWFGASPSTAFSPSHHERVDSTIHGSFTPTEPQTHPETMSFAKPDRRSLASQSVPQLRHAFQTTEADDEVEEAKSMSSMMVDRRQSQWQDPRTKLWEDNKQLIKRLQKDEEQQIWIKCKHGEPINYDTSYCRYGCPTLRRAAGGA